MGREVLSFAGTRLRKRCRCSGRLEHKQPCRCFGVVREPNRERCVVVDLSSQIGGITDFAETNTHVAGRQGVSSGSQARTVSLPTRQQQGPRAPFPFTGRETSASLMMATCSYGRGRTWPLAPGR